MVPLSQFESAVGVGRLDEVRELVVQVWDPLLEQVLVEPEFRVQVVQLSVEQVGRVGDTQ